MNSLMPRNLSSTGIEDHTPSQSRQDWWLQQGADGSLLQQIQGNNSPAQEDGKIQTWHKQMRGQLQDEKCHI